LADFAQIKAAVSITQVLDMLAITGLTPNGDTLRGYCPCCKEGNNRAFVVTPTRNIFYCFSERRGGSVIDLVARFKRIPEADAGRQIAAHFGLNGTTTGATKAADNVPATSEGSPERKPAGFDPREYQRSLDPTHAALKDFGIPRQPSGTSMEATAPRVSTADAWHSQCTTPKALFSGSWGWH
jgi:hypothetical protein